MEKSHGDVDYFDSYGLPPFQPTFRRFLARHGERYHYNPVTLQGLFTTVCGHYCLFFLLLRCKGLSMNDILQLFPSTRMGDNDGFVYAVVNMHFNLSALV